MDAAATRRRPLIGPARRLAERLAAAATAHPLTLGGMFAAAVAVGQAVTIWVHRSPGGFSGDEQTYSSSAMLAAHGYPWDGIRTLATLGTTAPLVPGISSLFVLLGPDDPRSALLAQALLLLVLCVAIGGITDRIAGPAAGAVATAVTAILPTSVSGSDMYFFGIGVAATMAVALWALAESDGGTNTWIWCYGVALGLLPLSRTMAIAYAPVVAGAGAWVAWQHPEGRRRIAAAIALAVAIFGPWYWHNRIPIWDYLSYYGYDPTTSDRFPGSTWARPFDRFDQWRNGLGRPVSVLVLALAATGFVMWWRRRRPDRAAIARHPVAPVLITIAGGYAALVSTANTGDWFDLPLIALSVVVLAAGWSRVPRVGLLVGLLLFVPVGAATLGRSWHLSEPTPGWRAYQGRYTYTEINSPSEDERTLPGDYLGQRVAAVEWWATLRRVREVIDRLAAAEPHLVVDLAGSAVLLNLHGIELARVAEHSSGPSLQPLDPFAPSSPGDPPMLIVVPVGDSEHPGRVEARRVARRLDVDGWTVVDTVPLPRHGVVRFYRSPEPAPPA